MTRMITKLIIRVVGLWVDTIFFVFSPLSKGEDQAAFIKYEETRVDA